MSDQRTNATLRVLILTLNLLNTQVGLTAARLLQIVPGYEGTDPASSLRKLERDIVTIRSSGLTVLVSSDDPPRYRITAHQGESHGIVLSQKESALLTQAAVSLNTSESSRGEVILTKLLAVTDGTAPRSATKTQLELDGVAYAPVLHQAMATAQPVAFDYHSRRGQEKREVAPWRLFARGRVLYLWGFDLNRWEPRLFRLSRFRSRPELIAEPNSAPAEGALAYEDFGEDFLMVSPLLCVRRGGAPLTRLRCSPETPHGTCPDGWELLYGKRDDYALWESTILRESADVVVIEPASLNRSILDRLNIAARWDSEECADNG